MLLASSMSSLPTLAACRREKSESACGAKSPVSLPVQEAYSRAEIQVLSDRLLEPGKPRQW